MRLKILTLTLLFIIVLTSGCVSIQKQQPTQSTLTPTITPILTPLPFQPGIWDKAVIEPPAGSPELKPPLIFDIDLHSSYGFEIKYLEYGTFGKPIFVLSRGKSATLVLLLNSSSNRTIQVSLNYIDGLPEGTIARLKPKSYALKPYEQAKLELNVTASLTAPISTPKPESEREEFVALRLKGDGWSVGRAFILKIN
ncbi:MAG: hypothetical protein SCH70_06305 [Candidatus Methanoperedens sp.]|nr:hypothetical protein [Candidatus Methanoperedens sp.]